MRTFKVSELLEEEKQLSILSFCQKLDKILGGGIPRKKITEVYGDKGIGKTTFCCQLAIDVQIPTTFGGLESECIYIDTENTFVRNRVQVMAENCVEHCRNINASSSPKLTVDSLLNGIHYLQCGTPEDLQAILRDLHEYILSHPKVKLLVIDSLAFPFYTGNQQFYERGKILYEISQVLYQLANDHNLAVVVTNNMTTRFSEPGVEYRIPFLGEIWSHIPNIRLHLKVGRDSTRVASIVKGHISSENDSAVFSVVEAGIRK